jgi:hypothetical protein
LVDGVDFDELQACRLKDFLAAKAFEGSLDHSASARITVVKAGANLIVIAIQQYVIDAPSICTNAPHAVAELSRPASQTLDHLLPLAEEIPHQTSAEMDPSVAKAMQLFQINARIVHASGQDTAAGGAKIYSQMDWIVRIRHPPDSPFDGNESKWNQTLLWQPGLNAVHPALKGSCSLSIKQRMSGTTIPAITRREE